MMHFLILNQSIFSCVVDAITLDIFIVLIIPLEFEVTFVEPLITSLVQAP